MRIRFRSLSVLVTALTMALGGVAFATVTAQVGDAAPFKTPSSLPDSPSATLSTNYAVPSGALFVATNGSDSNPGTLGAPFQSLAKAMKSVKAGGTIVVRGGVYRQGASSATGYNTGGTYYFTNIPSGVTIQAYPGEKPWFDGSQQVTQWTKVSSDHYQVSWSTPDFCAQQYYTRNPTSQTSSGPCSYPDSIGSGASLGDPQMVFRNGSQLKQVGSLSEMTSASTFYYDWANRVLHIKFDPSGSTVEVSRFAQAMGLIRPTNFSLKGIGFRRYASNQMHNATAGALLFNKGTNVLVENVAVTDSAGTGLQAWQTSNLTLRRAVLVGNGANGFNYDGDWAARGGFRSPADNVVIEYSRLDANNADRYGVNCTVSCGAAGVKLTGTSGIIARYSSFSDNEGGRGSGLWCDLGCYGLTAYGNVFDGNDRHGLVYEISDTAVIASNLITNNGWNSPAYGGGYGIYAGSARVRMYNNTLVNNNRAVGIYDDDRSPSSNTGGFAAARIGANTVGVEFVNNIVSGGDAGSGRQLAVNGGNLSYSGNTTATQAISLMASNSYHKPATGGPKYWMTWTEKAGATTQVFTSLSSFQSNKGMESNSQQSTASTNPYLVAPGSGDFSSAGTARGSGRALPSDIAALFGSGVYQSNRGVITLDGAASTSSGTPTPTPTATATATAAPTATPTTTPSNGAGVTATFDQAASSGWGSAAKGGAWSVQGSGFSASGGVGLLSLGKGSTRTADLKSVSMKDVSGSFQVGFDKAPGGEAHVNLGLRSGTDGRYRVKVMFNTGGVVKLGLAKVVGSTETLLAIRTLTGYTYTGGKLLNVSVSVVGGGSGTSLQAKAWQSDQAQPAAWQVSATDSQSQLQDAGYVGLSAYASSSMTNAPIVLKLDNLALS